MKNVFRCIFFTITCVLSIEHSNAQRAILSKTEKIKLITLKENSTQDFLLDNNKLIEYFTSESRKMSFTLDDWKKEYYKHLKVVFCEESPIYHPSLNLKALKKIAKFPITADNYSQLHRILDNINSQPLSKEKVWSFLYAGLRLDISPKDSLVNLCYKLGPKQTSVWVSIEKNTYTISTFPCIERL